MSKSISSTKNRSSVHSRRSVCPISFTLDFLGDKWTLLIVRDLLFKNKSSYGDFAESGEKIATNILANRLAKLEKCGIVEKNKNPENATKYVYTLTEKGTDLLPLLIEMIIWSAKYDGDTVVTDEFLNRTKDRELLVSQIKNGTCDFH